MSTLDRETAGSLKVGTWLPYLVDLLRSRFGLVTNEARMAMVQAAAERAVAESGLASPVHLLPLVRDGAVETDAVRALLRHVTIHESYFFRDERAVETLAKSVLPALVDRRRRERHLKIWSAGCAGGEEAYTLSILLRTHCDVEGWDISILGTDLDRDVLVRAREGVFTAGSLRTCTDADRERYFESVDARHQRLRARYRDGVRFDYDNLMDPNPPAGEGPFDLVMCRNVAIYFDRDGIAQLHSKISRHLAPDGVALLGLLEPRPTTYLLPAEGNNAGFPLYRRSDAAVATPSARTPSLLPNPVREASRVAGLDEVAKSRERLDAAIARLRPKTTAPKGAPPAPVASRAAAPPVARNGLVRARALADDGELESAFRLANDCIDATPLDPEPYLLAALVADELRYDEQAETLLRRVLYLAPERSEAHLRLSLLLARRGDRVAAARSMAEARRLGVATGASA